MKIEKETSERRYSISEAAKATGFSEDTLRYYEREGLLPGIARKGGRRLYTDANLRAVGLIDCLKKTGMTLADIREYVRLTTGGMRTVPKRLKLLRKQQAAVARMLAEAKACEERIAFKVWYYETAQRERTENLGDFAAVLERYRRETGRQVSF